MAVSRINEAGLNVNQYGNRNLIINGAMQVAQRGTARTVSDGSAEGYQTLDRFSFNYANSAGGVATISQDTTVPSGYGFSKSYKVDVATADTSIATDHMIYISQKVEAQNIRNSGWDYTNTSSYITLSFWARSVKAGIYNVVFRADDVGAKYYPVEYTLVADTWKKITITVPGDSSLVFNDDTGSGLDIRWNLQLGTARDNGTANQWNATDAGNAGTSNQVNFFDHVDNNFFLTGVQLEVGETATDFEHRSYGDELQKCKRYFESKSFTTFVAIGYSNGTTAAHCILPYLEKRVAPTVTLPTAGTGTNELTFRTPTGANPSTTGSNTVYDLTTTQGRVQGGSYAGLTAGGVSSLFLNGTASVTFDAEL